jgi:hypothetical protein
MSRFELRVATDVDFDELEGLLGADGAQDVTGPVAQVASGRVVERDGHPVVISARRARTARATLRPVGRNLLVITTVPADEARLAEELKQLAGEDGTIHIIAPAAQISRLDWLTNAEDDARAEASEASGRTAAAMGDQVTVQVDTTSQDTDAAQSIDDALRSFPADEVIAVTSAGEESTWLEDETVKAAFERSGVPVRHIEL